MVDRFHLLVNLREVLERLLDRHPASLRAATCSEAANAPSSNGEPSTVTAPQAPETAQQNETFSADVPDAQPVRDSRRRQRYEEVLALHERGMSMRAIARQLHMSRRAVRRFVRANGFPERAQRRRVASILDPYTAYLQQRLSDGCDNGMQLWREVHAQGYSGSRSLVSRWVAQHRPPKAGGQQAESPRRRGRPPAGPRPSAPRPLSARQGSWLLASRPEALTEEEARQVAGLCQANADIAAGYELSQRFGRLVRELQASDLESWLNATEHSGLPDLARFAAGIRRDQRAVAAALSLPWSNGQTEGQVNRLKLLKRQSYGRASFELLRRRVLAA